MKPIYIFPFSGTAKETLDCLNSNYYCKGFISDDKNWIDKEYNGIPIFSRDILKSNDDLNIILVHGSPNNYKNREQIINEFETSLLNATIIHPSAQVSKYAKIGKNVVIMANVVVSADVEIKDHAIILPNTTIHHDSIIGEYSLICGNVLIAGNVTIGKNCYIGAGSSIKNGLTISMQSMVGIGAVVTKNIPENQIWIGNPAKELKKNN